MSINLSATSSASNDSSHLMNALKPRPAFQVLIMWEESRLGREQLEVGYVLKQIIQAGVEVWFYLENRQRTLDSPIEKIMLSLTAFADELERERARQRTRDAMLRKAQAGHVTGGWCFGYRNIEITGADGRRSHVDRAIDVDEADIIRQIFTLCAEGRGIKTIAKLLNAQHAPSPRAQRGRSRTWAPSSVRDVLFRPIYRGEIVWAASAKRDRWGQKRQASRPEADWIRRPAPQLRIVSDELWNNAHARLTAARAIYFRGMNGQAFGRPPLGNPSKYLLSNLAACGCCCVGRCERVRAATAANGRCSTCSSYHERGRTVCSNRADIPMAEADAIVLEALLDDVLDPPMIPEAVDEAVALLCTPTDDSRIDRLGAEIVAVERERARLVDAIAAGGQLPSLLEPLRERETRQGSLWRPSAPSCAAGSVSRQARQAVYARS